MIPSSKSTSPDTSAGLIVQLAQKLHSWCSTTPAPRSGSKDTPQAIELGLAIAAAGTDAAGPHRHDLDANKTALYQTLGIAKGGQLGWLAVMVDHFGEQDAPVHIDQLAETMDDLAAGISDEYRYKDDLEMMTEELGERYEELAPGLCHRATFSGTKGTRMTKCFRACCNQPPNN